MTRIIEFNNKKDMELYMSTRQFELKHKDKVRFVNWTKYRIVLK